MRTYKLVLLVKSDLKKDEKQKLLDTVALHAGTMSNQKVTDMGGKKLAYTIKGAKNGEYVVVDFESEAISNDFERKIGIQEEVLRHLLIRED